MKTIIAIILFSLVLFSCKKMEPQYVEVPEDASDVLFANWEDEYSDGGTIPFSASPDTNRLAGTTWIIPEFRQGSFSLIELTPPDTLHFIDKEHYTYNGFSYTYDLYQSGNVYKLELYQTLRFGDVNTSLPLTIFDAGAFYLQQFSYQDPGMNTNNLFITMIRI